MQWPLGKLLNPSINSEVPTPLPSLLIHICHFTSCDVPSRSSLVKPPTTKSFMLAISGLHRARKSGRCFPNIFFIVCVKSRDKVMDRASPSHPECHSHSLRRQWLPEDGGVEPDSVGNRTKSRHTRAIIAAGAATATRKRTRTEIVSLRYGKDNALSVSEKSRLIGST